MRSYWSAKSVPASLPGAPVMFIRERRSKSREPQLLLTILPVSVGETMVWDSTGYYHIQIYYHSQIIVYTIMFYSFTITVLGIAATISSKNIIRNSVRTELSDLVELSCSSSSPWFFCVWEGPRGDRVCSLRSNIHQGGGTMCGVSEKLKMKGKIVTPKI